MTFTLSTIAAELAAVGSIATNAVTLVTATATAAQMIYKYGAAMIASAEDAYASQSNAGASKKAVVLAAVQAFVAALGEDWSKIATEISAWIDTVIAAWKNAVAIFTPAAPAETAAAPA